MKCKHCGNTEIFYTKISGVQYYDENAEPQGFDVSTQNLSVYCHKCNKRVCSTAQFFNQPKEDVKCKDCEYLMFSDMYGECSKGYKGIVQPNDSCGKGHKKFTKDNK